MNSELFARPLDVTAEWMEAHKGHPRLLELADRHYTRQQAGTNQCCRPGVNLVLLLDDGSAAWVVWRPIPEVGRKDGLEAWECTLFRNEGARRSSDLIREATAVTYRKWGWPPKHGLITAVGIRETKRRRSKKSQPGQCFVSAGWEFFLHPSQLPTLTPEEQSDPFMRAAAAIGSLSIVETDRVWLRAPHPTRTPLEAA
jgi:hypothetical protein